MQPHAGLPILLATSVFVILAAIVGVRRGRRNGRVDPFHPLLFPSIYVGTATLAPAIWLWTSDIPLGYISRQNLSARTPLLLGLAATGFTIGAWLKFNPKPLPEVSVDSGTIAGLGRLVMLVPLFLAARDFANNIVLTRGVGQDFYSFDDSLNAAAMILGTTGVALMVIGRSSQGKQMLTPTDFATLGLLVTLLALNGRRGTALALMIALLVYLTRRGSFGRLVFGIPVLLAFAYIVVAYRSEELGYQTGRSVTSVLLRDLGSVAFTTGVTDRLTVGQTLGGSTLVAAAIRLIPSPIAIAFFGQPEGTGTMQFRAMSRLASSNNGFGYSVPADGVINFGIVGAFLLPFLCGLFFAWAYSRFSLSGSHVSQWAYVVAVSTLPYGWRSDSLGAVKGVLYPLIILGAASVIAHAVDSPGRRQLTILKRSNRARRSIATGAAVSRTRA